MFDIIKIISCDNTYQNTYQHIPTLTYTRTNIHQHLLTPRTNIQQHLPTHVPTYTNTYLHTHQHTAALIYTRTNTQRHLPTPRTNMQQTHAYIGTNTHQHLPTHALTYTRTYLHTHSPTHALHTVDRCGKSHSSQGKLDTSIYHAVVSLSCCLSDILRNGCFRPLLRSYNIKLNKTGVF